MAFERWKPPSLALGDPWPHFAQVLELRRRFCRSRWKDWVPLANTIGPIFGGAGPPPSGPNVFRGAPLHERRLVFRPADGHWDLGTAPVIASTSLGLFAQVTFGAMSAVPESY